ncbi:MULTISPECIES: hypothetical protein [unclassified Halorubrum]|uniref:hypothetical protein n=1 Tax=unclassified Halorubrum TaxID=2642239 RepID=UPI000B98B472|nr:MULTISPECIES: hypothetical protein [unclassified Halorubrum]OYR42439.1 hypothetical protein DJ75_12900 [Halorubrum sp. Eb13]OYR56339.1 hypothetical protein DJ73_00175 [Halorubrum sp. Ea1]
MNETLERRIRRHNTSFDRDTGHIILPSERLAARWFHGVVDAAERNDDLEPLAELRIGIDSDRDRPTVINERAAGGVRAALPPGSETLRIDGSAALERYGFDDDDEATLRADLETLTDVLVEGDAEPALAC